MVQPTRQGDHLSPRVGALLSLGLGGTPVSAERVMAICWMTGAFALNEIVASSCIGATILKNNRAHRLIDGFVAPTCADYDEVGIVVIGADHLHDPGSCCAACAKPMPGQARQCCPNVPLSWLDGASARIASRLSGNNR